MHPSLFWPLPLSMLTSWSVSGARLCFLRQGCCCAPLAFRDARPRIPEMFNVHIMSGIWWISGFLLLLSCSHLWETEELGIRVLQGFSHCLPLAMKDRNRCDSRMSVYLILLGCYQHPQPASQQNLSVLAWLYVYVLGFFFSAFHCHDTWYIALYNSVILQK